MVTVGFDYGALEMRTLATGPLVHRLNRAERRALKITAQQKALAELAEIDAPTPALPLPSSVGASRKPTLDRMEQRARQREHARKR